MKGRLKDLTFGLSGEQNITVTVNRSEFDFRDTFDMLKDVDVSVDIKKYRNVRSKDANAYFHVLVNKIAAAQCLGDDEVKTSLVLEYGTLARDEDGVTVGFKLPASVRVDMIYPYAKCFNSVEENGKLFHYYMVYKQTRDMDTKEFYRLIDGAIYVARGLGIETDSPEKLRQLEEYWLQNERRYLPKGEQPS